MSDIKREHDPLIDEVYISESYLVALFWSFPEFYAYYSEEKINYNTFGNKIWAFYFQLGRIMADKGVQIFDDITVENTLMTNAKAMAQYEKYGGYQTIAEVMEEVRDKKDNFDGYYNEVKKYELLRKLRELFGDKVVQTNGKYDYHKLSKEQIYKYWTDRLNKIAVQDVKYEEHYLLEGLEEAIERWDKDPDVGLPFYNSPKLTSICCGWAHGNVYIFGGFGGKGKTSFTFNKVIMSCIENREKLLVIANEQGIDEFRQMLLVTAMGAAKITGFDRRRLIEGNFTPEEKQKLKEAVEWVRQISDGNDKLITFVFMEDYSIDAIKNVIRYYANRGVKRVLIDTAKPSEGDNSMPRWERFTEDFKEIYKLARPDGGLNLAVWANVQLADTALGRRFLDEWCLGESKKIKNEASVLFLARHVWDDEYEDGDYALEVYRYEYFEDIFNEDDKKKNYRLVKFTLKKEDGPYFLIFTAKNRRGKDNNTGLDVLVVKPNFNNNTWYEIGWTKVPRDRNYN